MQHENYRRSITRGSSATKSSPGNKLEKLKGALSGKYSIRINDQFRIVFNFARGDVTNVVIVDYH